MLMAPIPANEEQRLEAIEDYGLRAPVLGNELGALVELASSLLKTPMSAITVLDREVLLIKASSVDFADQLPRQGTFCAHAILKSEFFEVRDARVDVRFYDSPHVVGPAQMRFYASVPLTLANGVTVGTFCVADTKVRSLSVEDRAVLHQLSLLAIAIFEGKRHQRILVARGEELQRIATETESKLNSRTDYLAYITHELRTPIGSIISITDALFETDIHQTQRDHLTTILQSSRGLIRLTNDILDFSKIEAGKMELEWLEFELESLIMQTLRTFHFVALNKGIELSLEFERPTHPLLYGDTQRISQILTNLIGNAIKFTERGGVKIIVRTESRPAQREQLMVQVCDSGIGMSEETRLGLFQPYSQGQATIQRSFGGTGLGLVISKRLAELLEGDLTCESVQGQGSKFILSLPLHVSKPIDQRASPRARAAVSAQTSSAPSFSPGAVAPSTQAPVRSPSASGFTAENSVSAAGAPEPLGVELKLPFAALRILVAEDNEISQKVISAMLKKAGCGFKIVENGELAVSEFKQDHYDLVLLDCHMPKLNGLDAAREIRQLAKERELYVPILGITASSRTDQDQSYAAAGMDDTLEKPFRQDELQLKIARWVHAALLRPAV